MAGEGPEVVEFVEQLIHSRPINLQIGMHQNVSKIRHADNLISEIDMEDLMFSKGFDGIRCGFRLRPPVLSGQVVSYIIRDRLSPHTA